MATETFFLVISMFMLGCGSTLVVAAWPAGYSAPTVTVLSALTLGAVSVILAGYALAMVLA
jgi:hypothetical protein